VLLGTRQRRKGVLQFQSYRLRSKQPDLCATSKDFEQIFADEMTDLFRLALFLTADAEQAESCLILAMRDCFSRSSVSRTRVHTWARRMVMRNAIRLVWETPRDILGESAFEFYLQPSEHRLEAMRESIAILTLPGFDRLAFVICVLERYSILDCALLLRKAPQDVHEAVVRATDQVVSAEQPKDPDGTAQFSGNESGVFSDRWKYLEDSCGSILDYDRQ
jgi:DNA-directed RNA polymerase specialized sigma24 family protein